MRHLALLAAAFGLAISGSAISAKDMKIGYSDLDLTTEKGQKTLERRIENAISEVCETKAVRTGTRVVSRSARECAADAKVQAKQQVAVILKKEGLNKEGMGG